VTHLHPVLRQSFLFGDSEDLGNKNLGTLIGSLLYIEDIGQPVSLSHCSDNDFKLTSSPDEIKRVS
jgi:hypothetical protein